MKKYHFQIAVKSATTNKNGSVTIEGYASTPDIDRYKDIVEPKAFESALVMYMKNPVILRSHNADMPVGVTTSAVITDKGLKIVADITDEKTVAEIEDGRMRAMSIGYVPLITELQHEDGTPFNFEEDSIFDPDIVRVIKSLDLVEISIVSTPANAHALFTMQKSIKLALNEITCKALNIKTMEKKNEELEKVDEVVKDDEVKDDEKAVEDTEQKSDDEAKTPEVEEEVENSEEVTEAETVEDETEAKADEVVEEAETVTEPTADSEEAKSDDEEKSVLSLTENDAKNLVNLKTVGVIEVSEEAKELSPAIKNVIETADNAISMALKKIDELEAKLDTFVKNKPLVIHEQLGTPKEEVSDSFKSLFTN